LSERQFLKCLSGGDQLEDVQTDIVFSLPFPAGTANTPENVSKKRMFSTEPHFGNIVLPVDVPGGFFICPPCKKQAYREVVGRDFCRRDYEWEDMPGTGNLWRPALAAPGSDDQRLRVKLS